MSNIGFSGDWVHRVDGTEVYRKPFDSVETFAWGAELAWSWVSRNRFDGSHVYDAEAEHETTR